MCVFFWWYAGFGNGGDGRGSAAAGGDVLDDIFSR